MNTEYTITGSETAKISTEGDVTITIARTATGSTGNLVTASSIYGTAYFFVSTTRVVQVLAAIDSGVITGIPYDIDRPLWAEAVQCATNGENCEAFNE